MTRPAVALILSVLASTPDLAFGQVEIPPTARYRAAIEALAPVIERERTEKSLPAVSVAIVADGEIVWARGFGHADPNAKVPATAETIYRVGSVSKLFTALALMQLVEAGAIDLDSPVDRYLSGFRPKNPFDEPITLRRMASHRAGLVRESPVGNYFDASSPSLAATVDSLNGTTLVFSPGTRTKYSNAAVAAIGRTLEVVDGKPFEELARKRLLEPLKMSRSGFTLASERSAELAKALMWTTEGREFPAPTFPLGTAPAGNLYSTAVDLGKFLTMLLAKGQIPDGRLLKADTLDAMWTPQCVPAGEAGPYGIGFALGKLDGHRRVGHGGAVYGFATEVAALPDYSLGVAVLASRDCANGSTRTLADLALRTMLAVKAGSPLPQIESTQPIPAEAALAAEGRYVAGDRSFDLFTREGRLYLQPNGGVRSELRAAGDEWLIDDAMSPRTPIRRDGETIRWNGTAYHKVDSIAPGPIPERWSGLIGEYGWDHNILYILERDGKLHALIEWFFLDPLEELDANTFAFPKSGLYDGERLIFLRGPDGRATAVEAAGVVFPRRPIDGEDGKTFRITPVRPVDELRGPALAASPPKEVDRLRPIDLVDITTIDPSIKLDIRYATANNFLGVPVYSSARAFAQRPVAQALGRIQAALKPQGYGLLIHDAYRPWHITKVFWDATPEASHDFVADPSQGSKHNRGAAIDLSLHDLKTGEPVAMVGGYDEFSGRSHPYYPGGTSLQRAHRERLRRAMETEGFRVNLVEWWHFDHPSWVEYPLGNLAFDAIQSGATPKP